MKDRLIQLLDLEQLSPSKFADIIGVQRSSISHVISGRNKPSFDFLQKTLKAFPGLNASWLMLGEGTMYEQMGRTVSGNLFDAPAAPLESSEAHISEKVEVDTEKGGSGTDTTAPPGSAEAIVAPSENSEGSIPPEVLKDLATVSKKRIVQLMVIYDDDTFRAFAPAH